MTRLTTYERREIRHALIGSAGVWLALVLLALLWGLCGGVEAGVWP